MQIESNKPGKLLSNKQRLSYSLKVVKVILTAGITGLIMMIGLMFTIFSIFGVYVKELSPFFFLAMTVVITMEFMDLMHMYKEDLEYLEKRIKKKAMKNVVKGIK